MDARLPSFQDAGDGVAQEVNVGYFLCQQLVLRSGSSPRKASQSMTSRNEPDAGVRGVDVVDRDPDCQRPRRGEG
eukprot:CAMPEP_0195021586 /NCGR_PEP_ID=MMETSP0326_2-20130528/38216_1 /TAXON_ID=2866 ORGANISM="Crypthecodinium cohnii, Strain Seligo" /NCGR_SAMPLE_ID=MMETSP0326_2 /ASSEMBLY_ACC=CAM_ASM_000348 /LENGTH=74 /DNA_ID=CAMNT_0040040847 /DNA_START=458 /DNA_END=678 /DNA_ORIENTATION=+